MSTSSETILRIAANIPLPASAASSREGSPDSFTLGELRKAVEAIVTVCEAKPMVNPQGAVTDAAVEHFTRQITQQAPTTLDIFHVTPASLKARGLAGSAIKGFGSGLVYTTWNSYKEIETLKNDPIFVGVLFNRMLILVLLEGIFLPALNVFTDRIVGNVSVPDHSSRNVRIFQYILHWLVEGLAVGTAMGGAALAGGTGDYREAGILVALSIAATANQVIKDGSKILMAEKAEDVVFNKDNFSLDQSLTKMMEAVIKRTFSKDGIAESSKTAATVLVYPPAAREIVLRWSDANVMLQNEALSLIFETIKRVMAPISKTGVKAASETKVGKWVAKKVGSNRDGTTQFELRRRSV